MFERLFTSHQFIATLFTILFIVIVLPGYGFANEDPPPYQNASLPVQSRVDDLLSRMSIEEKCLQLFMVPDDVFASGHDYRQGVFGLQVATAPSGDGVSQQLMTYNAGGTALSVAQRINEIQHYFVKETRLGIPIIPFDEALHGLVRSGATAFPQSIALAATWDRELISRVAAAIAKETGTRGIRQILSPVVNIARDVRWGRTEETYGEDPFLASRMAVAFVSGFEKRGIVTTPKHFVANVGAGGRDSYPIHFNRRLLEEIYFPAFKACFQEGGSRSVMTAYNSLDGIPCSANNWLLNEVLKGEWGFAGFVISDAGAVPGMADLHLTAADYGQATAQAINNGLDVVFQTDYNHFDLLFETAVKSIDPEALDRAVARVLRVKFELGLFENPYVDAREAERWNGCDEHKRLAREAAQKSIVLLKNEGGLLPIWENGVKRIALLGSDAVEARLGGYSGPGENKISILDGLLERAGQKLKIKYSPGPGRDADSLVTVPSLFLSSENGGEIVTGLSGSYFDNIDFSGEPVLRRIDPQIDFTWTLFSPAPSSLRRDWYSVRWNGWLTAPLSGELKIGVRGNDGYRLYIDDQLVIDNWRKQTVRTRCVNYRFEKGKKYRIRLDYFECAGNAKIALVWDVGTDKHKKEQIEAAVENAKSSDLAVIVAGIEEGEFRDRALLSLPGLQEELILRVAETGVPVVVVLVGGSAVTMSRWIDRVDAIVDVWYPGEQGGPAVADVLFGDYNPAGRLPVTFPHHEGQLPLYYNHKPTGRGDDYLNLTGAALFPFGYGLSYTTFAYSDPVIGKSELAPDETTSISLAVTNSGPVDGEEVVQLYIKDLAASVTRPVMELKGFKRIFLKAGETRRIEFEIGPEQLSMLDAALNRIVEEGEFRIMIGASSQDIRLQTTVTVRE